MELLEKNEMNDKNDFSINYINEIKKKVNIMKKNTYRTVNFSIIVYFVKNNFHPLNKEILISNLIRDYKASPNIFISNRNYIYKTESSFRKSIRYYIKHNNCFYEEARKEELKLNYENAVYYLRSVFNKYKNNSRDVKTPVKSYDNKNNRNRNYSLCVKKELTDFDSYDEDEKIPLFLQKGNNVNNYNNKYNYQEYLNKIKQEKTDDESKENKSIISLSDESITKSDEKINYEYTNNIPKIFVSKLFNDSVISSIDKKAIFSIIDLTSEYMTNIKNFDDDPKIKDKFNKLYTSLQNLLDTKQSHEKVLNALNTFQAQIFDTWKLLKNQLYSVNLTINTKNYRYDLYVRLRDIIFKEEGIYKENLEKIKYNLNELYALEKKSKEEAKIIQRTLISIKNEIKSDNIFDKIYKLIKDKLNIKENFQLNDYMSQEDEFDFFLVDKVGKIVNKFHDEKKQIMEEIKFIDKNVGNIIIY